MNPKQRDLARHALGLDGRCRTSYRNHFVTRAGSDDHDIWMAMVAAGWATRRRGSELTGGADIFRLTSAGATAALIGDERLDAEDFPNHPRSFPHD